jgi:uncharacterized OB-fold protein
MTESKRPLPRPTPETAHFWEGAARGELRLQRCDECAHVYFPPRPFCPACSSRSVSVFAASGRGFLDSYVINERPHPAFDGPYSIALVRLEEGPRLMTNIVGCEQSPEALVLDMPVRVAFEKVSEDISLPLFTPADPGQTPAGGAA